MSANPDHYKTLNVAPESEDVVIRAAYLALIQKYHPDRFGGDVRVAEARTKEINAAFAVLGDATARAAYDRRRRASPPGVKAKPGKGANSTSGGPGPVGRATSRPPPQATGDRSGRRPRFRPPGPPRRDYGTALTLVLASFAVAVGAAGLIAANPISFADPLATVGIRVRAAGSGDEDRRVAASGGEAIPTGVLLPWPADDAGGPRRFVAHGVQVSFPDHARADAGTPLLIVRDTNGASFRLPQAAGFDRSSAVFGIGRLDASNRADGVILASRPRDSGCCMQITILERRGGAWRLIQVADPPMPTLDRFPSDVDGDGAPEIVIPDPRFVGTFGPVEQDQAPPRILQIQNAQVVDVSTAPRFHRVYADAMAGAHDLCALGVNSGCAAFVANAARLGRAEWAWAEMLRTYDHDSLWTRRKPCGPDLLDGRCPAAASADFPDALARALVEGGYVHDAARLLASAHDARS